MTTVKQALESAIEALNDALTRFDTFNDKQIDAIQACYDALESLEKCEPVGEVEQIEWVGLPTEKIKRLADKYLRAVDSGWGTHYVRGSKDFARAFEAKLKELNTKG